MTTRYNGGMFLVPQNQLGKFSRTRFKHFILCPLWDWRKVLPYDATDL